MSTGEALPVGRVAAIFRYPVKSMGGERLAQVWVDERGVSADRLWAVREVDGSEHLLSAKRVPALLLASASFLDASEPAEGGVEIALPDGAKVLSRDVDASERLSSWLGRAVRLRRLPDVAERGYFRRPKLAPAEVLAMYALEAGEKPDFSRFPIGKLRELAEHSTVPGTHFDAYPLHVLTTGALASLQRLAPAADFDVRRFRPNLLIESAAPQENPELEWCGGMLECGEVALRVEVPTPRCSVPTRAQPGLGSDPEVMRVIARARERHLGVYCGVARAGTVRVGDEVRLRATRPTPLSRWASEQSRSFRKFLLRNLMR